MGGGQDGGNNREVNSSDTWDVEEGGKITTHIVSEAAFRSLTRYPGSSRKPV